MEAAYKSVSDLFGILKSWTPWRSERNNVSRDFWMPDQSCRVCYECDTQFTLFNRRHHCRLCGRVFCAKCTPNWIPPPTNEQWTAQEESEKIRVCNFCFKQWEQGSVTADSGIQAASVDLSTSSSMSSFISTKSTLTVDSSSMSFASIPQSVGSFQDTPYSTGLSLHQSALVGTGVDMQSVVASGKSNDYIADMRDTSQNQYGFCMNRF